MRNQNIAISIDSIAHTYRQLFIGGRVIAGPIVVGDRFNVLCTAYDESTETPRNPLPVDFSVVRILTYGKYLNRIDRGMTCELELEGEFTTRVGPNDVLVGQSEWDTPPHVEVLGEGDFHVLSV